jgi:hypothetical protein
MTGHLSKPGWLRCTCRCSTDSTSKQLLFPLQLNSNSYDEYVSALNDAGYAVIQVWRISHPHDQHTLAECCLSRVAF